VWALDVPGRATTEKPYPGAPGAVRPLLWSDSLAVITGEGAGVRGFDATLVRVDGGPELIDIAGRRERPMADLVIANGWNSLGDNALSLEKSDSLNALRLEAASGNRGPSGSVAGAGRDLYGIGAAVVRGAHHFEAAFDHRRLNADLVDGSFQRVRGEGGHAAWRYRARDWTIDGAFVRAYDSHSSGGGAYGDRTRLADQSEASLTLARGDSVGSLALRGSWRQIRVRPDVEFGDSGSARARELWGAARAERARGGGRIEAELGIGHQSALGRTVVVPSLAYRLTLGSWSGRAFAERLATPVWSDLARGTAPFLQDTWAGGLELRESRRAMRAGVGVLAGRAADRAFITRVPLEALALREGFSADPSDYSFALVHADGRWQAPHWGVGAEGFVLGRSSSPLPELDPAQGARAFVDGRFRMFQGDLEWVPAIEAAYVGERQSEAGRTLPRYVTFDARLRLTLADAVMLFEALNLEDRIRPQVWIDRSTGVEATGPGLELRFIFSWRLWD
jgi:hypothetical protein